MAVSSAERLAAPRLRHRTPLPRSDRGNARRRRQAAAIPSDRRLGYDFAVTLTVDQEAQLQAKATAEVLSLSSYIAKLVAENLAKG